MTARRLHNFLDALAAGKQPRGYRADAHDAAIVRAAITVRAARPGENAPREDFVAGLFERLSAEQAQSAEPAATRSRPSGNRVSGWPAPVSVGAAGSVPFPHLLRSRQALLLTGAAAVVLVTGSVVATETLDRPVARTPVPALGAAAVRTGSFQTADGQVLGQVVAYRGRPSWIFLNVDVPRYQGQIVCKLQIADGTVVAFGTFPMTRGAGQFSRSLSGVDVAELRGARLYDAAGAAVASATFTG